MVYECIICMENLESSAPGTSSSTRRSKPEELKEICATTACGHVFHRACLNQWFTENGRKSCPSCRIPLSGGEIFRIYPSGSSEDTSENNRALQMTEIKKCIQICEAHKILIDEYDDLLENYARKCDNAAVLYARNTSLEEECNRLRNMHSGPIYSMINTCEHIFEWIKFLVRLLIVLFRNSVLIVVSLFFTVLVGIFLFQLFRFVQLEDKESLSATNSFQTAVSSAVYHSGTYSL